MGYDCDILAYDEDKKFIGFIVEDYSLAWFREFNFFMIKNGKKVCRDIDDLYESKISQEFLYYCEKNGLCREEIFRTSIQIAKKIRGNKKIKYIGVSCC